MNRIASVFIVEDDLVIVRLYQHLLKKNGYDIQGIAYNGQDAVDMYNSFDVKPDIILMDYRMPVKNGIEATQEILKLDNKAKIIFASADGTIQKFAKSIGVLSFKTKPFDNKNLLENIQKNLNYCDECFFEDKGRCNHTSINLEKCPGIKCELFKPRSPLKKLHHRFQLN